MPVARHMAMFAWLLAAAAQASAQVTDGASRPPLSDDVRLDQADAAALAHLERLRSLVAGGQHEEALDTLHRLAQTDGERVYRIEPNRYVSLREYCHVWIGALPADALAAYRRRVDPLAESLYRQGLARNDSRPLEQLVEQYFGSSWGDDALLALGDMAVERGQYAAARGFWMKLFESPPTVIAGEPFRQVRGDPRLPEPIAAALDKHYEPYAGGPGDAGAFVLNPAAYDDLDDAVSASLVRWFKSRGLLPARLAYPDSTIPRAALRARLVLADILEGSHDEAEAKLKRLGELHPDARGHLAGVEGAYAETLDKLLAASRTWAEPRRTQEWPTFGGSPARGEVVPAGPVSLGMARRGWEAYIGPPVKASVRGERELLSRQRRIGESWLDPLSYHPVVAAGVLFYHTGEEIRALDLATGRPAWPTGTAQDAGAIWRGPAIAPLEDDWFLGVPRMTLTVHGRMLLARMGGPATSRPAELGERRIEQASRIIVLDISDQGQGRLLCDPIEPDGPDWAFEGAPLTDGRYLYVAMRRSDVRPQVHVACYDLASQPTRLRWRRFVAAAETAARGQLIEITHNLLTLQDGVLYYNTNLGAVAALSVHDGQIRWIHTYPRARSGGPGPRAAPPHAFRDLNPAVFYRGLVLVAPADSPSIIALDADTGALRWSSDGAQDAVHLVGVYDDELIATGDRVAAIDVRTGKLRYRWPDAAAEPRGMGRGIIAGGVLYWPTRDELYLFDLAAGRQQGTWVLKRQPIALERWGLSGGNLLVVGGRLIVANGEEIVALE